MRVAVEPSGSSTIPQWPAATEARDGLPAGPWFRTPFAFSTAFRQDPLGFYTAAFRTFGDVVCFRSPPFRSFLVAHPDHIKHVLQENNHAYEKGVVIAKLKVLIGDGLFSSEGDFWRRQRRLAQPAFHRQRLAGFVATMTDAADAHVARWEQAARAGTPVDVAADMSRLTLGIVGRTLFSRRLDDEADAVGAVLMEALELLNHRAMSFLSSPLWWPSSANRRLRRAIAALDRVVFEIIEQRRRTGEPRDDLLGMLLQARDEDTGESMTDRQLRDEVMTFLLAGHETTAVALTWTWHLLAQHPDVEARLAVEATAALGGRTPTIEDIPRLAYARMVVEETMRLYPPVWGFMRQAVKPDVVGGYRIPKGAVLAIVPYVTHRHPAFWDDPERFDPERFTPARVRERPRFAYLPFSGGPRLCIGNEFALMEAQLVLAMVALRFRLRAVPGVRVESESRITLRPRGGLPMTVTARA
jgi:cytochrome P450